jgi:hypothetical protein
VTGRVKGGKKEGQGKGCEKRERAEGRRLSHKLKKHIFVFDKINILLSSSIPRSRPFTLTFLIFSHL